MEATIKSVLLRQHDMAYKLLDHHVRGLTTEACLWRPAGERRGLHIHQDDDDRWVADWPKSQGYDIGPASIGWLTWHLIYWWQMVIDHNFGPGELDRHDVEWPGDADALRHEIDKLHRNWVKALNALDDESFLSTRRTRWPFTGRPFADVAAWANTELTKSAAEIGYVLFARGKA